MKCEDEVTLPIDVGWLKKNKGPRKSSSRTVGRGVFFMLFGWDMDSFLVQSVYFFTFHSPIYFGKA